MWNYRLVRKKTIWKDKDGKERINYGYGIHEAFYDKNGKVTAITEDPVEIYGENAKECRHAWVMQAEAFGHPILDYDKIPEEGVDKEDPLVKPIAQQELVGPEEQKEFEQMMNDFDADAYRAEEEVVRIKIEKEHVKKFVGIPTRKKLISALVNEYYDNRKKEKSKTKKRGKGK
jgi:hypothetical protein